MKLKTFVVIQKRKNLKTDNDKKRVKNIRSKIIQEKYFPKLSFSDIMSVLTLNESSSIQNIA